MIRLVNLLSRPALAAATVLAIGGCASGSTNPFGATFGEGMVDGGDDGSNATDDTGTGDAATGTPTGAGSEGSGGNDGSDDDPEGDGSAGDESTGSAACDPPCDPGDSCVAGTCFPSGTDGGSTTGPMECHDVEGEYVECLGVGNAVDTSDCGGNMPICITGGDPVIVGVCSVSECVDECDCPAAPAGATAVAACDAITGDDNLCYLDCAAGTCPTGMECFADLACLWPGEGADGEPFGDCFNNGISICGLEGTCLSDDADDPTVSVCTSECTVVGDCPAAPPGGTASVSCEDVTAEGGNECVIDCSVGTCPTGMTCFNSQLCMWN